MRTNELIDEYIKNIDVAKPIYTNDIYDYVNSIEQIDKLTFNEYLHRFEKNNHLFVRYTKGIYYKTKSTPFGNVKIDTKELIKRCYLSDDREVFGYISGPSVINELGLSTQIPGNKYIVTNNYRAKEVTNNLKLLVPQTKVTLDNYKYLQILDVINNKYDITFECDNPNEIIYEYIRKNDLSFEKLLFFSMYYKKSVLLKLQEIARER